MADAGFRTIRNGRGTMADEPAEVVEDGCLFLVEPVLPLPLLFPLSPLLHLLLCLLSAILLHLLGL